LRSGRAVRCTKLDVSGALTADDEGVLDVRQVAQHVQGIPFVYVRISMR
jgi:hypothetical protein